jgi:hypothetical protein
MRCRIIPAPDFPGKVLAPVRTEMRHPNNFDLIFIEHPQGFVI